MSGIFEISLLITRGLTDDLDPTVRGDAILEACGHPRLGLRMQAICSGEIEAQIHFARRLVHVLPARTRRASRRPIQIAGGYHQPTIHPEIFHRNPPSCFVPPSRHVADIQQFTARVCPIHLAPDTL